MEESDWLDSDCDDSDSFSGSLLLETVSLLDELDALLSLDEDELVCVKLLDDCEDADEKDSHDWLAHRTASTYSQQHAMTGLPGTSYAPELAAVPHGTFTAFSYANFTSGTPSQLISNHARTTALPCTASIVVPSG
jgi:hypothetical protein